MKKRNKRVYIALPILLILTFGFMAFVSLDPFHLFPEQDAPPVQNESVESSGKLRADATDMLSPYKSAAITCRLDFVDTPEKLNREEALEKIKALSLQYPKMLEVYNNEESYSNGILLALANNPEMLDFTLGYLSERKNVYGFYTKDELAADYPLFLQWDFRWGYMQYGEGTLGTTGCGPTALAMAIFYLTRNEDITPDVIAQYSLENKHYVKDIGTSWSLLDEYPTLHGLTVGHVYPHAPYFKSELDKGNILICSVKEGDFTYGGHFIVIYGYDDNGFKINDPKCIYRSNLTWSFDTIRDDIRRVWTIGK